MLLKTLREEVLEAEKKFKILQSCYSQWWQCKWQGSEKWLYSHNAKWYRIRKISS